MISTYVGRQAESRSALADKKEEICETLASLTHEIAALENMDDEETKARLDEVGPLVQDIRRQHDRSKFLQTLYLSPWTLQAWGYWIRGETDEYFYFRTAAKEIRATRAGGWRWLWFMFTGKPNPEKYKTPPKE
jgi:hypothetical protein